MVLARSLKIGLTHTYGWGVTQTYGRGVSHTDFGVVGVGHFVRLTMGGNRCPHDGEGE